MDTDEPIEQFPNIGPNAPLGEVPAWEQRTTSGRGGRGEAGQVMSASPDEPKIFAANGSQELAAILDRQLAVAGVQRLDTYAPATGGQVAATQTNELVWQLFNAESLYDTKRITLEHFHLFEWFPLSPGLYHTRQADAARRAAYQEIRQEAGHTYYHPRGKAQMVRGGVGAVRLLPMQIGSEAYVFMTASSSGVCHQGFPVLVPRHFYGAIKERIAQFGAAPATLSGEMRYVRDQEPEIAQLFQGRRDLPRLYLHIDQVDFVDRPRDGIDAFAVSVVVSFFGEVDNEQGTYVTFATFDPRDDQSVERSCDWIEEFYVHGLHHGTIVTDFDAVRTRFPQAVFGLNSILRGELNQREVRHLLVQAGLTDDEQATHVTNVINTYHVGTITNSTGIAIGPGASASVTSVPPAS